MKTKKKQAFILYELDEFTNDYNYIAEYYNIKELQEKEKIQLKNHNSLYHYITNSIDNINHLLNDKYIIIKESLED